MKHHGPHHIQENSESGPYSYPTTKGIYLFASIIMLLKCCQPGVGRMFGSGAHHQLLILVGVDGDAVLVIEDAKASRYSGIARFVFRCQQYSVYTCQQNLRVM